MLLFVLAPIAYLLVAAPLAVGLGRLLKQAGSDQPPIYDLTAHEFQRELKRRRESAGL